MTLLATQTDLDLLADRLEQAYRRRHPNWLATALTPGVWTAAAARLAEVAGSRTSYPVDPELFIAVQDYRSFRRDPWSELTQDVSAKLYRAAVRKIIRQLRLELRAELRWSKRRLVAGHTLEQVLAGSKSRLSPITKLALCLEQDRGDLAAAVRPAAEAQHRACPLYRFACKDCFEADVEFEFVSCGHPAHPDLLPEQAASFPWN